MKRILSLLALVILLAACDPAPEVETITAVDFHKVTFSDGFWQNRIETNNSVTIQHNFRQCEDTGRIDNFAFAAREKEGGQTGYFFNDSDVYKNMEAAAYALQTSPNAELEDYMDRLTELIGKAQEEDGYLYTAKTAFNEENPAPGGKERWTNVKDGHELYCVGHLYEAAVAYYKASGKRELLDIALKNADLVCEVFGPGGIEEPPGHQEIEIGLFKLYQVTGEKRYRDMAKYFLDVRGNNLESRESNGEYDQDHLPVMEQKEVVGHAVRANYMYCAMADATAITGEQGYLDALHHLWHDAMEGKLYITGGYGAAGNWEGFGESYDLPNMTAYCETCSSIAGMFWNHRMFLHTGDGKYLDVLERSLYNAFLAAVDLDGQHFFYPNPLESVGQHQRSEWFNCACCPPNIARFIASMGQYFYAVKGDRIYVNLYGANTGELSVKDKKVTLEQRGAYPWDGKVSIVIDPGEAGVFELALRIPVWAQGRPVHSEMYSYTDDPKAGFSVKVNNEELSGDQEKGFFLIRRSWQAGDTIELSLPMDIRKVKANAKIEADRGRIALERGPIVYCVEWPDVDQGNVRNLVLESEGELTASFRQELLSGVQVIRGKAKALSYNAKGEIEEENAEFTAIPYFAWSHRGKGEMQVWLAEEEAAAHPEKYPTIASQSKVTSSCKGELGAVNDQHDPASSGDSNYPRLHWWPRLGSEEWLQYDFKADRKISAVEVYWFDDGESGRCRVPKSWQILYKAGERWLPVKVLSGTPGVEKDKFNRVEFEPVKTDALRLEITSPEKFAGGVHEWKVY